MRSWRTIRQRRDRARRGQVSAVATILGLLLFVSLLSNYVILQLPNTMSTLEYQHVLTLENEFGRLQTALLAEVDTGDSITLTVPVSLGSIPSPPFGPAASGQLTFGNKTTGLNTTVNLPGGETPSLWSGSGLAIQVANLYTPATTVAYEAGAIILYQSGGTPVMIDPPPFSFSENATTGVQYVNLTTMGLLGTSAAESGIGTAGVSVQLVTPPTMLSLYSATGSTLATLRITTDFAQAWATYFAPYVGLGYLGNVTCVYAPPGQASVACGSAPSNIPVIITAPVSVQFLTVTFATFTVALG